MILERHTVHVSDDAGRIAMLEKRTIGTDDSLPTLTRYVYSNHLQSASLELDEYAAIVSYEEIELARFANTKKINQTFSWQYHPYGTTAFQAKNASINSVAKRYRYTGKERDEESGLYYHGARYYIPWLCRWTAIDPMESKYAGMSPYNYSFNNPVMWNDLSGADPDEENPDGGNAGGSTPNTGQKRFLSYKELGEQAPFSIAKGVDFLNHGTYHDGFPPSEKFAKMLRDDFGFNNNLLVFSLENNEQMGKRLEKEMTAGGDDAKLNKTILASMTNIVVKVGGRWQEISENVDQSQITDMKIQVVINSDIKNRDLAYSALVYQLTLHALPAAKVIKDAYAKGDLSSAFDQLKNHRELKKQQNAGIFDKNSVFNQVNAQILKHWDEFHNSLPQKEEVGFTDSEELRTAAIQDGYTSYAVPLKTAYNSYLDVLANMQSLYSKGFKDTPVETRSKTSLITTINSGYFDYPKHVKIIPVNLK